MQKVTFILFMIYSIAHADLINDNYLECKALKTIDMTTNKTKYNWSNGERKLIGFKIREKGKLLKNENFYFIYKGINPAGYMIFYIDGDTEGLIRLHIRNEGVFKKNMTAYIANYIFKETNEIINMQCISTYLN